MILILNKNVDAASILFNITGNKTAKAVRTMVCFVKMTLFKTTKTLPNKYVFSPLS